MKSKLFFIASFFISLIVFSLSYASDTDDYWKKVDTAINNRLPKTAIENLNVILKITEKKKLYNEWLTALTKKIILEVSIEGNKPEQRIGKLKPEIDKADENIKPVLGLMLARWYWKYFEKNRWRLLNRTVTEGLNDRDFTTWDGQRILKEIDSIYWDVIKQRKSLVNISTSSLIGFLEEGNMPIELTPTLYDFALREALGFYQNAESYVVRTEDKLEIDANSDAFAEAEKFIHYDPPTDDTLSFTYKVIRLFQALIKYYKEKGYYEAYLDIDIRRLNYIKKVCYGEDKNEVYIKRLTELVEHNKNYSISSFGAYYLAKALAEEGDNNKAYELAKKTYDSYPNSLGGAYCHDYMAELTQQSLKVISESYVPSDTFILKVHYKNVSKVYFKAYKDKWDEFLHNGDKQPLSLDDNKRRQFLVSKPDAEWVWEAPEIDSLNERVAMIKAPKLQPGFYWIFASCQPDFNDTRDRVIEEDVGLWVCNFTVIFSEHSWGISGFVLDAVSGEPIEGALVKTIIKKGYYEPYKILDSVMTDNDGYFSIKVPADSYDFYYLLVNYGIENSLICRRYGWFRGESSDENKQSVIFFTDRSIYRPGQTIHFKGICVDVDHDNNTYNVVPNKKIEVVFKDVNRQEIARQVLITNEFGSISGHFIIPTDVVTGRMLIESKEPGGSTEFRVEEYKRPKFVVSLEKPKGEHKLNSDIEIVGQAISYTGAPISNAEVRFTVERDVSYPSWLYWIFNYSGSTQKIKHGKIKTDSAGYFKIVFFAKPDPKVLPENEPTFIFKVTADVISPDGETHSTYEYIRPGYTAIKVDISKTDGILLNNKSFGLVVNTSTMADEKVPANVKVEIYRLKEPSRPVRKSLTSSYYWRDQIIEDSVGEFGENWIDWPEDKLVYVKDMCTKVNNPDTLFLKLPCGLYKAVCKSKDSYGKEARAILPLIIWPVKESKKFNIKLPFVAGVMKEQLKVGDRFEAFWGTGYDSGRCHIRIEQSGKILKKFWTPTGNTMHSFSFQVTENLRGGFVVNFIYVRENRVYQENIAVEVPWTNKELDVIVEHFRDKLQPGEKETVTLRVKGKEKPITEAEVLATMYDYSLDQYYPNIWNTLNIFKWGRWRGHDYKSENVAVKSSSIIAMKRVIKRSEISLVHFPAYVDEFVSGFSSAEVFIIDEEKTKTDTVRYSKLKGKIIDAVTWEPLFGVRVIIVNTEFETMTNFDGEYAFNNIEPGVYTISVSRVGHQNFDKIIGCVGGKTTVVNFKLAPTHLVLEAASYCVVSSERIISLDRENKIDYEPVDLIPVRKNFNETAFFYPHLLMNKEGEVKLEFTIPEALTKWKFMAFAHGKECESGIATAFTVARKDLMVQPNVPRFLREKDTVYFTANVVNVSDREQSGFVRLDFNDAVTEVSMNKDLGLENNIQKFKIGPNSSEVFYWKIILPKGTGPLSYTIVAKSTNSSDGETAIIPVLSSRIFLIESKPFSVRGPKTKTCTFKEIESLQKSKTREPFKLTVQVTSNPVWYAIQALPYLNDFPYECNEQIFNRYYANSLAEYIAKSNPKIKKVFDQWMQTGALKSNLEKNKDLKSVTLMETPWVLEAQRENQAKQNISLLFQENTLRDNLNSSFYKLKSNQNPDGSWSWFPGCKPSPYITMYIVAGFGKLKHLGVDVDLSLLPRALAYLDSLLKKYYIDFRANNYEAAMYLYCRSFFMEQYPPAPNIKKLIDSLIEKMEIRWQNINSRLSQGYLALALHRLGRTETAVKILRSIKEHSVVDEEMGMYWRDLERYWYWYRAPIETQALMIEAFTEVMGDMEAVEACKTWLIQQKRTQNWKTTKATADAIYALILRGKDYISSDAVAEIKLGSEILHPDNVEVGTGYYEKAYLGKEIKSEFANITFSKKDDGVAWASVHLQYFDEMSNVKQYSTGLSLEKRLFVKRDTKRGKVIEPLNGPVNVGDVITVRIILRADQDMEYLHLKDMRGSGLEPVDVLSCYRYQDRLGYYQSTKDVATHFFIDYLPKGTYVFEYDLRVQLKGKYQSGIAEIQCMYAPEFNSHSESYLIEVR